MTPYTQTSGTPVNNVENRHFCRKIDLEVLYPLVMFPKLILRIVEVHSNVLVLISQVAALNWSNTIYPNLSYPVKSAENRDFCTKGDLKVLYPLVMFLKHMLRIVEVYINVFVLISQVAALNWSDTIYPNLGYQRQKRRKSTFFYEKWSESTLSISDFPKTYVENSWGLYQRFCINQPSGCAQLKWHHIPKLRVPPWKRRKSTFSHKKVIWKYLLH